MAQIHDILFNMIMIYSFFLGAYAAFLAAQNQPLSGNFWGAVAVFIILTGVTGLIGVILALSGMTVASEGRLVIYFLYMLFLFVIMPGLFSMLRGRDDRSAAIAFSILDLFNASVAFSMLQRGLVTWVAAG